MQDRRPGVASKRTRGSVSKQAPICRTPHASDGHCTGWKSGGLHCIPHARSKTALRVINRGFIVCEQVGSALADRGPEPDHDAGHDHCGWTAPPNARCDQEHWGRKRSGRRVGATPRVHTPSDQGRAMTTTAVRDVCATIPDVCCAVPPRRRTRGAHKHQAILLCEEGCFNHERRGSAAGLGGNVPTSRNLGTENGVSLA